MPDARWRKVLHRMQREILARLRRVAGDLAPRRLGFVEGAGGATRRPGAGADRAAGGAGPAAERSSARPPAIADPELRARFLEIGRALPGAARNPPTEDRCRCVKP